jgi:bla regulator protein blaR1
MTYYSELASFFIRILANSILIGTPISIGIFTVLTLTRAATPRARYLLTVTGFFVAAVLPFVVTLAPTAETPRQSAVIKGSSTHSAEIPGSRLMADGTTRMEIFPLSEPNTTPVNLLDSSVRFLSQPLLSIGLFTLWLAGACLLLVREATTHLKAAKARHQWTPATAKIREQLSWPKGIPLFVDNELGPCALGVLNSIVVIPARLLEDLPLTAARQIARHELDHLKWRDPFVHSIMRIVRASLWFSAPLWYLDRATRLEREAASDRAAMDSRSNRLQPDIAAVEYAATLVSIAKRCARTDARRKHAWIATEIGNESGLKDRVRRLIAVPARPTTTRVFFAFASLLVTASSLFILPVAKLESKPRKNSDQARAQIKNELTDQALFEMGPAKQQANKPVRVSSLNRPLLSEAQNRPQESNLAKTQPEALVEDVESARPSAASATTINTNTIQPISDLQLTNLESQMAALGYKDLTAKQLADMRAYAVGPAYVAEMADSGYSGLSADMLISFKWFGVSSSYIREMSRLGYDNLSPRTLVHFREYGVSADYIQQMRSRLSGSISGEQLASLRFFGASTEFVDKLKGMGYANLNAGQLISMRLQGVSIAYVEALEAKGHKGLSADDLIGMRMRGSN